MNNHNWANLDSQLFTELYYEICTALDEKINNRLIYIERIINIRKDRSRPQKLNNIKNKSKYG